MQLNADFYFILWFLMMMSAPNSRARKGRKEFIEAEGGVWRNDDDDCH